MKIVFIAPFGLRPKGTVIARMTPLAAELQTLGHEVVIVAPPYTNPEDSGKLEMVRGVMVRNIRLGPLAGAAAAPLLSLRLLRAALAERPDLVHLFKPKGYGGIAAMLQLFCRGLGLSLPPLFLDTDDWEGKGGMNELHGYSDLQKRVFAFQERWIPPRALGVTVASRGLEELVLAMGLDRERLCYLPNCVEDLPPGDGRVVRDRLGIAPDAPVLLLYTRFFEFSQERLHQVFAGIVQRVPGVRFLVVGRGRRGEEELLQRAARTGGFHDSLVMAGWVEPAELPDYLAAGDVALYPFDDTLVNRTKCPAKLTELLAAGVPVVADRVGQIPEYVAPECHPYLCSPDDREGMIAGCSALLLDPARRGSASKSVRDYILGRFGWREHAGRLNDFYLLRLSVAQRG